MMERTPEQYAIEHGEYLATAADSFMKAVNDFAKAVEEGGDADDDDVADDMLTVHAATEDMIDTSRALASAIYEFRKRAARVSVVRPTCFD